MSTYLDVYVTDAAGSGRHTLGSFLVDHIQATTPALRPGVTFKVYDREQSQHFELAFAERLPSAFFTGGLFSDSPKADSSRAI